MQKNNEIDDGISSLTIKNWLNFKKNIRNSVEYKKSIKNLVQFKISKKLIFLSLAARLVYT